MSADWNTYRIEDIAEKITIGPFGSRMKSDAYVVSGVPVIRGTNLTGSKEFSGDWVFITEKLAKQLENCCVSNGDLVFPHRGSIGEVGLVDNKFPQYMMSSSLMKLRCNPNIADSEFIYYFFKSHQGRYELLKNASQVGTPGIGQPLTSLKNIAIKLPPLEEQRKISKILSDLDDKIHLNTQINQTLESIAQAIFKSWFIDFEPVRAKITAKLEGADPELAAMCAISGKSEAELEQMAEDDFAELQATAALFPDELVESELGEVPRGWKILDIDKTTSLIIDHRGKTPKKLDGDWSDSGITVLSAKHVKDGCIVNREQLRFVDTELYNKWMKDELEEGDILLTSEGPMGEMYYLAFDEKYCLSQRLYALRANTDLVSSTFLYFWLLSPFAKSDMNGRATGTTVVGIRQSELRKVKVLTPSKSICDLFHRKIKANLKQIALNNNESVNLAQIRDILLPKLLSGEVDVSDLQGELT